MVDSILEWNARAGACARISYWNKIGNSFLIVDLVGGLLNYLLPLVLVVLHYIHRLNDENEKERLTQQKGQVLKITCHFGSICYYSFIG